MKRILPLICLLPLVLSKEMLVPAAGSDIAVLYALDADWQSLAAAAKAVAAAAPCGDRRLQRFSSAGHSLTAVKMGSGCAETAVSAACVLASGHFDLMITLGPAGALKDRWKPGDLVVIDRLYPWQTSESKLRPLTLPAAVATRVPQSQDQGQGGNWRLAGGLLLPGVIGASGELFVNTAPQRQELAAGAEIVDMNTLGAETAAAAWKVPCLHVRVISDHANESAREDFLAFVQSWDGRSGKLAWDLIQALKPDPAHPDSYEALRKLLPDSQPKAAPVPAPGSVPEAPRPRTPP